MVKLTILFLAVVCLQATAAGQKETVTISGKDLSLEKVFSVIKKQTDYVCFYGYDILRDAKPVSLSFKNAEVQEVLKAALWGQGLDFSITGKTITITKKSAPDNENGPGKTVTASGTVFNEAGQPLPGANVTIKTSGKGTITNAKGEFELPIVPEGGQLVVSFIGYAPQVVKVSEGKSMQVFLKVAKDELDKVVVQAYGTTTQRLATGNIATVTAAEIERQPVMNPIQALQGEVPGLVLTQNSSYASSPVKIELRGRSGLNPNIPSDPLYIVDGVPLTVLNTSGSNYDGGSAGFIQGGLSSPALGQSPFFSINSQDIESITVLKDADATAIYGSRGANGVIILTTKKGKAGKTKFDLNIYQGFSKVTQHYDLLNTQQYLMMRHEALNHDGIAPSSTNAYDLLTWDTTRYTDWQKVLFGGTGKITDVNGTLSGGDKFNTFRISSGYRHETGILQYSGADQRASLQLNLGHKSQNQKLSVSITGYYSYAQSDNIFLNSAVLLAPDAPAIFDDQNHLNYKGWVPVSYRFPFGNLLQPYTAKTDFLNSQLTIQYELLDGLFFSADLGYSTNKVRQKSAQPIASQNPQYNPTGSSLFGNNNANRSIIEPQLEYKRFIGKGKIDVLAGATIQHVSQDGNSVIGQGYVNDNLLGSILNASQVYATDAFANYKYAAVFGRINYNWENKYILNLSARRDGSSRFGPGKQFGNFGAIGAAWVFTEEKWLQDQLSILSFGKLRASYGLTGSDNIGDYQYLTQWQSTFTNNYQQGQPSYTPLLHANPNLQWETNKKLEMAISLGFLKDRFTADVAWYQNLCGNQLIDFPLPIITGFPTVTANYPAEVRNTGWEITIKGKLIEKKDFDLSVNFRGGWNHNTLLKYPNLDQSPYAYNYVIGKPLNLRRLFHYTGVDPTTGKYTFEDKNHDNQISGNPGMDDYFFKDLNVRFDGGAGADLRYKGWNINLFFTLRVQPYVSSPYFLGTPGIVGSNQPTKVLNRWKNHGDIAKYAAFTTQPDETYSNFGSSDGIYSNGSYVRLRNLSVSYDLPEKVLKTLHMENCRFYLRGQNLFIITKYDGIDPDTPLIGAMPPPKILTCGIQFNF